MTRGEYAHDLDMGIEVGISRPPAYWRTCHALGPDRATTLCGFRDWRCAAGDGFERANTTCPECRAKLAWRRAKRGGPYR